MKKLLLGAAVVLSCIVFGQKVRYKKDLIYIDKVPAYRYEETKSTFILNTLNNQNFLSIIYTYYKDGRAVQYDYTPSTFYTKDGQAITSYFPKYQEYDDYSYIATLTFLKDGKKMFTDMPQDDLIARIFASNLADNNGNINEENVNLFILKYNNDNLKLKLAGNLKKDPMTDEGDDRSNNSKSQNNMRTEVLPSFDEQSFRIRW